MMISNFDTVYKGVEMIFQLNVLLRFFKKMSKNLIRNDFMK